MELDVTQKTQRILYLQKTYEPDVSAYVMKTIRPGEMIVDIGANVGFYTLLGACLVGEKGYVFSFEPEENNYHALLANIRRNGYTNINALKKAIGEKTVTATLYLNPLNEGGHSLDHFDVYHDDNDMWSLEDIQTQFPSAKLEERVEVVSLDDFFSHTHIKKVPRLVKIDVEGKELSVLHGMQNLLSKQNAPDIISEVGQNGKEVIDLLKVQGYHLYTLNQKGAPLPYTKGTGTKIKALLASKQPRRQAAFEKNCHQCACALVA